MDSPSVYSPVTRLEMGGYEMITLTKEQAQQVLDGLKAALSDEGPYTARCSLAESIMRQALSQPEPELYAYAVYFPTKQDQVFCEDLDDLLDDMTNLPHEVTLLYTRPTTDEALLRECLDALLMHMPPCSIIDKLHKRLGGGCMSEVTPLPSPDVLNFETLQFSYTTAQLHAYGAAEYARAIEDAAIELEGLRDQTGLSVSKLLRNLK
jgi:hypothetical protein